MNQPYATNGSLYSTHSYGEQQQHHPHHQQHQHNAQLPHPQQQQQQQQQQAQQAYPQPQHHHRVSFHGLPTTSQAAAGSATSAPATPHALPPIGATDYGQDNLGSRGQRLPSSLAEPSASNQLQPVYGPTQTRYMDAQGQLSGYSRPTVMPQVYKTAATHYNSEQSPSNSFYQNVNRSSRLPDIRPMPINTYSQDHQTATPDGTPPGSATRYGDDLNQPIHVVGSQGRRGILPVGPGRPPVMGDSSPNGTRNNANPTKDAEGKFPCEHCAKSYLHAKHLKRHMLRHTGIRPYTCGLCHDTFSRSDILKRHFQKCSARRGNPTGESHLSHSRRNKKMEQRKAEGNSSSEHDTTPTNFSQPPSANSTTGTGNFEAALDIRPMDLGSTGYADSQRPSVTSMSRSSSVQKRKISRSSPHRTSLPTAPTSSYDANIPYSTDHVTPDSINTSGAATPYTYPPESRSNQISPDGSVPRAPNGLGLGLATNSRPGPSQHYPTGSLPHIVSQNNSRTDLDWQSYPGLADNDFSGQHYNVSAITGQAQVKPDLDFSNLNHSMFHFNQK